MTKQTRLPVYAFIGIIISSVMLGGCIIHVGANDNNGEYSFEHTRGYSSTNKSVSVAEGLSVGDVSSVNGSVTLADEVSAKSISNVNGRIRIGDNVSVSDVAVVNGKIAIGKNFSASESVETVNGNISIDKYSKIGKNIETVNGTIELDNVMVDEDIKTINGSVYLLAGSVVKGDVVFEDKPNNNSWKKRSPILKVDADSDIQGKIIIYKDVDFEFADNSLMNKVERR